MKKFLAIVLMLAVVLSLSAAAFAVSDITPPGHSNPDSPNAGSGITPDSPNAGSGITPDSPNAGSGITPGGSTTGGSPNPHSVVEPDVYEPVPFVDDDADLREIEMPKDVSVDDDDVVVEKLINCPDYVKTAAKQQLAELKKGSYTIDCGFGAWSKSGRTASCTIKLSEKDVPAGSEIFVNGAAVNAELKDGYYYFTVNLPAVVLVAHK